MKRKAMASKRDRQVKVVKRNRKRGRRNEKVTAEAMGFDLKGLYGGEDAKSESFSAEYKDRKKFVGFGWMEQAIRNCPSGKIPLVVIHITHQRRSKDLVMMRLSDWVDWYGKIGDA
ncbi:MAG: hypothetical protein FVQ80_06665 [Planctomycetes bacterium]|nr:hypothetical protein [Planctomycetota bacterium]